MHSPRLGEYQAHAPCKGSHTCFAGCILSSSCMLLCTSVSAACASGDDLPLVRCASHCVRCAPACAHAAPGMKLDPLMAGRAAASAPCGTLHLTCASVPSPAAGHQHFVPQPTLHRQALRVCHAPGKIVICTCNVMASAGSIHYGCVQGLVPAQDTMRRTHLSSQCAGPTAESSRTASWDAATEAWGLSL